MRENEEGNLFKLLDCDEVHIIPDCHVPKKCCKCKKGPTGATGPTGITGATGATGATGICECSCISTGEMVVNGGMETVIDNRPVNWNFSNLSGVESIDSQGRVHSGNFSVNISDDTNISQTIDLNEGGCYYRLSFFARGEGAQAGLEADVIFNTTTGPVNGGSIIINDQDINNSNRDFGFYQLVTSAAPNNVTSITIKFIVSASGEQSVDLDDVSLTIL